MGGKVGRALDPTDSRSMWRRGGRWIDSNVRFEGMEGPRNQAQIDAAEAAQAAERARLLAPDATDEAVQAARIMERRKQIGMNGRMSTFLTTGQGASNNTQTTVLGG